MVWLGAEPCPLDLPWHIHILCWARSCDKVLLKSIPTALLGPALQSLAAGNSPSGSLGVTACRGQVTQELLCQGSKSRKGKGVSNTPLPQSLGLWCLPGTCHRAPEPLWGAAALGASLFPSHSPVLRMGPWLCRGSRAARRLPGPRLTAAWQCPPAKGTDPHGSAFAS